MHKGLCDPTSAALLIRVLAFWFDEMDGISSDLSTLYVDAGTFDGVQSGQAGGIAVQPKQAIAFARGWQSQGAV